MSTASATTGPALPADWTEQVRSFWFDETPRDAWFRKDDAFDERCRSRFGLWIDPVAEVAAAHPPHDAQGALAAVIVLDQLPRNLFRGTGRAFAHDCVARAVTAAALAAGSDRSLGTHERLFLYLPLEHSEDLLDQERAVALIASLGDAEYTRFAIAHRDIIARFGRFPHRNAVLGRASSPKELAFLSGPGSSF